MAKASLGKSPHLWEISCRNSGNRQGTALKDSESNYKKGGDPISDMKRNDLEISG
jgi:hypothetical protein